MMVVQLNRILIIPMFGDFTNLNIHQIRNPIYQIEFPGSFPFYVCQYFLL